MKLVVLLLSILAGTSVVVAAETKPIAVVAGEEFKITLESNPSTGNQWLIAKPLDERLLKLLGSEFKRGRPGAEGASGNEILKFKALNEGKTQIHLKYGRLFEEGASAAKMTNFVVVISKSR